MDGFLPLEIDNDYMSQLYEDMELLLEDETIYEDNDEIFKRVFRYHGLMQIIGHHIAECMACVILFIVTPMVATGIFRHVFMTKAAMVFNASLMWMLGKIIAYSAEMMRGNMTLIYDLRVLKTGQNGGKRYDDMLERDLVKSLGDAFEMCDMATSLVLTYELYQCTQKMEKRDYSLLTFVKMLSVPAIIVAISFSLQQLVILIQDEWWRKVFEELRPLEIVLNLMITFLIVYCGIQSLLALRKSDRFQNGNSSAASGGKHQHLVHMIYILISAQFFKNASRIVQMALFTATFDRLERCIDAAEKSGMYNDLENCHYNIGYPYNNFFGVMEMILVFSVLVVKKCKAK